MIKDKQIKELLSKYNLGTLVNVGKLNSSQNKVYMITTI